jgi:hypothetical protein
VPGGTAHVQYKTCTQRPADRLVSADQPRPVTSGASESRDDDMLIPCGRAGQIGRPWQLPQAATPGVAPNLRCWHLGWAHITCQKQYTRGRHGQAEKNRFSCTAPSHPRATSGNDRPAGTSERQMGETQRMTAVAGARSAPKKPKPPAAGVTGPPRLPIRRPGSLRKVRTAPRRKKHLRGRHQSEQPGLRIDRGDENALDTEPCSSRRPEGGNWLSLDRSCSLEVSASSCRVHSALRNQVLLHLPQSHHARGIALRLNRYFRNHVVLLHRDPAQIIYPRRARQSC